LNIPPRVLSYYKKWSYFIAKYASDRYNIQVSFGNLTISLPGRLVFDIASIPYPFTPQIA
jgi:hypothetical protein